MSNRFLDLLASRPCLLADGATGTNLFKVGLQAGDASELWNVDHPERIRALHQRFVEAGAAIIHNWADQPGAPAPLRCGAGSRQRGRGASNRS